MSYLVCWTKWDKWLPQEQFKNAKELVAEYEDAERESINPHNSSFEIESPTGIGRLYGRGIQASNRKFKNWLSTLCSAEIKTSPRPVAQALQITIPLIPDEFLWTLLVQCHTGIMRWEQERSSISLSMGGYL